MIEGQKRFCFSRQVLGIQFGGPRNRGDPPASASRGPGLQACAPAPAYALISVMSGQACPAPVPRLHTGERRPRVEGARAHAPVPPPFPGNLPASAARKPPRCPGKKTLHFSHKHRCSGRPAGRTPHFRSRPADLRGRSETTCRLLRPLATGSPQWRDSELGGDSASGSSGRRDGRAVGGAGSLPALSPSPLGGRAQARWKPGSGGGCRPAYDLVRD